MIEYALKLFQDFDREIGYTPLVIHRGGYPYKKTTDSGITFEFPVPGYSKESLDLQIEGKQLVLKVGDLKHREWLPEACDTDSVTASYENGMLTVVIGYKEKEFKKITID